MNDETCTCKEWDEARQSGTDHEMYGAAITEIAGEWSIGDCARITFCPFCGKPARPVTEK